MSSSAPERITSPWVMGVFAAAVALGIALVLCVVPALAGQLAAQRSSMGTLGAVLLGLDVLVLGHGGVLLLSDGAIRGSMSLMPMGLTALFVGVCALQMRRMGRALALVGQSIPAPAATGRHHGRGADLDAGILRPGALRDAGIALGAFVIAYGAGGAVLAAIARTSAIHAVTSSTLMACALVALVGGLCGLVGAVRSPEGPRGIRLSVLGLVPAPYGQVLRAIAITVGAMLAAAMLTVVVALGIGLPSAGALWDQLSPGIVGGIVLALCQIALLPTLGLWALAALLGGRFDIGLGTSVALSGTRTSALPALPVLGALPGPGASPWYAWLLLAVPLVAIGLGAVRLARDLRDLDLALRPRLLAYGGFALGVLVVVLALLGLSGGGIGTGRLQVLGPDLLSVLGPLAGMCVLVTGIIAAVMDSPLPARARLMTHGLRRRVEASEAAEAAEDDD